MYSWSGDSLILAICAVYCLQNAGDVSGKRSLEVGQELSDVVSAGAEDGKERISERAWQQAS